MGGNKSFPNNSSSQVAAVTLTAGTNIIIVAAGTATQTNKLVYLVLEVSTGGTIQIFRGTTAWSGVMTVPVGLFTLDLSSHPWITAGGESINITTVTTVAAGSVEYVTGIN